MSGVGEQSATTLASLIALALVPTTAVIYGKDAGKGLYLALAVSAITTVVWGIFGVSCSFRHASREEKCARNGPNTRSRAQCRVFACARVLVSILAARWASWGAI